tara:strand:- start:16 stop:924 length:909 start_codon:yes stop_codon:yes gene_type:complete
MAYASSGSIEAAHYNGFVTSLNAIWGVGTGVRGLGQTTTLAAVSASDSITASQWATLLTRLKSISSHQGNDGNITIDSVTNPSAGDSIAVIANIATDIGTLDTSAAIATVAGLGSAITDTAVTSGNFSDTITQTDTLTFASEDKMRTFFNAGGKVTVSWALSGHTSDAKANEWSSLTSDCGTWTIFGTSSSKVGGSATGTVTQSVTTGFSGITGSNAQQFKQTADASPYTANYVQLNASKSGGVLTLESVWKDDAPEDSSPASADITDGSKTTTFTVFPPSYTHITDTFGTPAWATTVNSES